MPDPVTTAIATAVAGNVATAATAEAVRVLKEISARIRARLRGEAVASAIPADPLDAPASPRDVSTLAGALEQAFRQEPHFAREVKALWDDYLHASGSTYANDFHGTAHISVMIGEHHGDLNING